MLTDAQRQQTAIALAAIRNVEDALDDVVGATGDPNTLSELNAVYDQLTDIATTLVRVQTVADDQTFEQITCTLNDQARCLAAEESRIQSVISDAAAVGKVLSLMTTALAVIAQC